MSLVDLAKKEWERKKKEIEKKKWKEMIRFVEDVKKAFKEKFHVEPERIVPQSTSKAIFECDGVKIVATGGYKTRFYLMRRCSKCGKERYDVYSPIESLSDLGRQLEEAEREEFVCEDCQSAISTKNRNRELEDVLTELLLMLGVQFEE